MQLYWLAVRYVFRRQRSNIRYVVCIFIKLCRLCEFTSVNDILITEAQWNVSAKDGSRFP